MKEGWWELTSEALLCNYINKSWASWMWLEFRVAKIFSTAISIISTTSWPFLQSFLALLCTCWYLRPIPALALLMIIIALLIQVITCGANLFFMTQSLRCIRVCRFLNSMNARMTDCHTVSHSTSFQLHFLNLVPKNKECASHDNKFTCRVTESD